MGAKACGPDLWRGFGCEIQRSSGASFLAHGSNPGRFFTTNRRRAAEFAAELWGRGFKARVVPVEVLFRIRKGAR